MYNSVNTPLLEIRDLKIGFPITKGLLRRAVAFINAVDGVSFKIEGGKTVGLVGESGSGKTTLGRSIIRLNKQTSGAVFFKGQKISDLSVRAFFPYRKKIQMVFQDPFSSLNPRMKIMQIIAEPLQIHFPGMSRQALKDRVVSLLEKVGLGSEYLYRYPHEFSGGQRQRINIARALAVEPEFIICDESVSALDVSVQAQIINLLQDLQKSQGLTYLFITHDLALIEHLSDYILIMQKGKIVEQGETASVYTNPQQLYTKELLEAVPSI